MMKMNKKILALLLAVMMLIGLVGCGENNDPTQGTTDPAKATEPPAPGADDGLTLHENTFFKVGYDEEAGWSLAEDDFDLSDSGGYASVRVLDGDNNTEILVEIEAYETDASSFRESLHFNGLDQKAYVEGTLETVDIGGQTMVCLDKGDGERCFFGRNEAAGVTYTVNASNWDDSRVPALIENITCTASGTDNIDPPWYWEGEPFSSGKLSKTVGTHTLTADFLPMAEPMVTYETFDHDIAVVGDKVYLLSDGTLYQYAYEDASLTLLKDIPLDEEYPVLEKGTNGEIILSGFMMPMIKHDGNSVLSSYEGPEKLSVAPDGTWGISWFYSGDDCKRYSFSDGTAAASDFAFGEVDSISQITIDSNYILVGGSAKEDGEQYIFVYDHSGALQLKLAGEPDGFGLGSITYAISTANGFLALDGNMREVVLWTADGTWLGAIDDEELFGTHYPWFAAADTAPDGSILIVMSEERADESADEVLVFKLSGF